MLIHGGAGKALEVLPLYSHHCQLLLPFLLSVLSPCFNLLDSLFLLNLCSIRYRIGDLDVAGLIINLLSLVFLLKLSLFEYLFTYMALRFKVFSSFLGVLSGMKEECMGNIHMLSLIYSHTYILDKYSLVLQFRNV